MPAVPLLLVGLRPDSRPKSSRFGQLCLSWHNIGLQILMWRLLKHSDTEESWAEILRGSLRPIHLHANGTAMCMAVIHVGQECFGQQFADSETT